MIRAYKKNSSGVYVLRKRVLYFDCLVILFQLCCNLSLVHAFVFDMIPLSIGNANLTLFMLLAYLLRFGPRFRFISQIGKKNQLIFLWIIVLLWEVFQGTLFFMEPYAMKGGIMLIDYIFFMEYLYELVKEKYTKDGLFYISRVYCFYDAYSVLILFISAILLSAGLLDPESNLIPVNSLTRGNVVEGGINAYTFPGYLSVAEPEGRILDAFNIPMLSGLSHEPHVYHYSILPAFFLLWYYLKKKGKKVFFYILLFLTIVSLFVATSATSLLVFPVIMVLHVIWQFYQRRQITRIAFFVLFCILIYYLLFLTMGDTLNKMALLLEGKLTDTGGSKDYSAVVLNYFVTPSSLFGHGIYGKLGLDVLKDDTGVGLISSFLIVGAYLVTVLKAIICVFSSNQTKHFIGLSCLYFLMHTLKVGSLTFRYPLFIFIIFILSMSTFFANQEIRNSSMDT